MPDNRQIDEILKYVLDHSPVVIDDLSSEGKKLVHDTCDIIETARLIVKEKNADELFQNFVWHTRDVSMDKVKLDGDDLAPIDRSKLVDDRKAGKNS